MAKQTINLGTAPTGIGGDTPRSAFTKVNANFDEVYGNFFQRSNIVGGVAQVGGVPTGAVMDFGTFANGFWAKFASGLQICIYKGVATAITAGTDYTQGAAWAFPIPFIAPPLVLCEMGQNPTVTFSFSIPRKIISASSTTAGFRFGSDTSQTYFWDFFAIGRWF